MDAFFNELNEPGKHLKHNEEPVLSLYWPGGHLEHFVFCPSTVKNPLGQVKQVKELSFSPVIYRPAIQLLHTALLTELFLPVGQSVHDKDDVAEANVFRSHSTQLLLPSCENSNHAVPGKQRRQKPAPAFCCV
jgi:hypothetical protein